MIILKIQIIKYKGGVNTLIKEEKIINDISDSKDIYMLDMLLDEQKAQFYDHRNDTFFVIDLEKYGLLETINNDENNVGNFYELPIQK